MTKFIQGVLDGLGLEDWVFQKISQKPYAKLIFLRPVDGQRFLALHGKEENSLGRHYLPIGRECLVYNGRSLHCSVSNRLDEFAVQSLEYERKFREERRASQKEFNSIDSRREDREFACTSISCGLWDYVHSEVCFTSYFTMKSPATMGFKSRSIVIETSNSQRLAIPYPSIESIVWNSLPAPTMLFSLHEAPRFSRQPTKKNLSLTEDRSLQALMESLFNDSDMPSGGSDQYRAPGLNEEHDKISGGCRLYQVLLADRGDLSEQVASLSHIRNLPSILHREVRTEKGSQLYATEMLHFLGKLSATSLPFPVKFQVQRLVQNCYLPPSKVAGILPAIEVVLRRSGERICVNVLRTLFREIPYAGPDVDAEIFGNRNLCMTLDRIEANFRLGRSSLEGPIASDHVAVIHKVTITPSCVYLDGPDGESNNRVLRKYAAHQDYFLKLHFCDEDGSLIQYSRNFSNAKVFDRFKTILEDGVKVGGRHFMFLGHSHSSVRAQACWAVAPFTHNGIELNDRDIVKEIGDFSNFRCPARCAARIGQAFSDTRDAITLDAGVVRENELSDVSRNDRVFSDGVGTISMTALRLIWEQLYRGKKKPTVLQFRYRGMCCYLSFRRFRFAMHVL